MEFEKNEKTTIWLDILHVSMSKLTQITDIREMDL